MSDYERVIDLALSYPDESELGDLISTLCDAIRMYDGGFGDMPGKPEDLRNACKWLLHIVDNDVDYWLEYGDGCDEQTTIFKWLDVNRESFVKLKEEYLQ